MCANVKPCQNAEHVVMNVTKRPTAADSAETLFESCSSCKKLDTTTQDCLYIASARVQADKANLFLKNRTNQR